MLFSAASTVWVIKVAMVIGQRRDCSRVCRTLVDDGREFYIADATRMRSTSMTTAPGLIHEPRMNSGLPTAPTTMSPKLTMSVSP